MSDRSETDAAGADRGLIAIAAFLLPASVRPRHREQWLADAAGAREQKMRAGSIGLGALSCALTYRRSAAEAALFDSEEIALGRTRRGVGLLLASLAAAFSCQWFTLSTDDPADGHAGWIQTPFGVVTSLFGAIALVLFAAGYVELWRGTVAARSARSLAGIGTLVLGFGAGLVGLSVIARSFGDAGPGALELALTIAFQAGAVLGLAGCAVTALGIVSAMARRPALAAPAASASAVRRAIAVAWVGSTLLVVLGLVAAIALPPISRGLSVGQAFEVIEGSEVGALVFAAAWLAAWACGAFAATGLLHRAVRPGTRSAVRATTSVSGLITRIGWLWVAITVGWWVAVFGLGMSYADAFASNSPHLGLGDLYPAIGQAIAIVTLCLGSRDTRRRARRPPAPGPLAPPSANNPPTAYPR